MAARIWFITGASSGFGRECAKQALTAGNFVAAAARRIELLDDLYQKHKDNLLPLKLDVTDAEAVKTAVAQAVETFGGIDVLVNNAGMGFYASIEELFYSDINAVLNTNFTGSFNTIQAVMPYMRVQKSGRIIQISSLNAVAAFPLMGAYSASKWAVEGLVETLAAEVKDLGIKVSLVEPGPFDTGFHKTAGHTANTISAYDEFRRDHFVQMEQVHFADPAIVAAGILKLADMQQPPLRVAAGENVLETIKTIYTQRLADWHTLENL